MKQKERYTLQELYDNLPITLTDLSKLSGKSHGTLTRIREGEPARRSTINKLMLVFSDIYKLDLSIDNVEGFVLEERQQKSSRIDKRPSISSMPIDDKVQPSTSQNRNVARFEGIPDDLPTGTIKLVDFVSKHGLSDSTVGRWIEKGLKGEKLKTETRIGRNGRPRHFLTPDLQIEAIDFLKRHGKA